MIAMPSRIRGLYAIVSEPEDTGSAVAFALALLEGGASVLQLRVKSRGAGDLYAMARLLAPLCRARGVPFIVDDRLDVALAAGADGVHLGQDDLPLARARRLSPAGFLIGVSTHSLAQAEAAQAAAADYIGFGPVFATRSKANPDPLVGLEGLARACRRLTIPVVAIGGIGLDKVAQVARAGARAAALIAALAEAPDAREAARRAVAAFAVNDPGAASQD